MKKIAIVNLYDHHYREIADITARNKSEYCEKHNYSLHIARHLLLDPPATFSKIPLLEAVLPLHDWIVWIDSDALIMNFNTRIESYLDDSRSLIIGREWNGINAGVFFLRRSPWSMEFLRKARAVPREVLTRFRDQEQMLRTLESDPDSRDQVTIHQLKQAGGDQDFNCYPEHPSFPRHEYYRYYEDGDFIVHFAGTRYHGEDDLPRLLQEYSRRIIK